jgi:O-antigen/teichoic acid export membrane protein
MSIASLGETIRASCPRPVQSLWGRIAASELHSRLVRGAFWSLAGAVISQGLALVALIVAARVLGKTQFGEYGMIASTVGALGVFAGLGLGLTATKFVAEHRLRDPGRAGRILGLSTETAVVSGLVVSVSLYVLAPVLAERTLNAPQLVWELRLGCALLFLNALNGMQTGALCGLEAFKAIAWVTWSAGR